MATNEHKLLNFTIGSCVPFWFHCEQYNRDPRGRRCWFPGRGARRVRHAWFEDNSGAEWNGGDLANGGFLPFHSRCHVVCFGATKATGRRAVVVFSRGHCDFFRFALSTGRDQFTLAGRPHAVRWSQFSGRVALAGVLRPPREGLKDGEKTLMTAGK